MEKRVDKLENEMDDVKVRLAVAESNIDRVEKNIMEIKDDTRWLRRTITGAIITGIIGGIIGLVFALIKLNGG
ncbi:MAG: hemolysin activation protein [Lysinibacillus sp.]|nr:hemolysin activation protein [Lysinibacillus sp.]